jgi:starch phosphorylase
MKALRSFSVRPSLPPPLAALERLAMNLRWSWDERTRDLFRWVDPQAWDDVHHDPVRLLGSAPRERLEALANDQAFVRYLSEIDGELTRYLGQDRWFQARSGTSPLRQVAYFSPEFGISEALPQYSGGLGVLAGDHLKAASDLGLPLVGVGLLYRNGYFRQSLSMDGWQEERYPVLDPYTMAVRRCDGVRITVDLAGEALHAQVWRADVGRTALYLLDTDVDENSLEARQVTDRLYGGDTEHRLRQEILLGIGGVRALRALGVDAQVFHTNEGHAGFLGLERIRQLVGEQGLAFAEALEAVRAGNLFTTHTPVPAGIDRFPRRLLERYFSGYAPELGVTFEELFALGQRDDEPDPADDPRFNMAVMGLRLAARSNAVARLHGAVSRSMFAGLWPDVPLDEVPITSVTNGVHARTWASPEIDDLLSRYVTPEWTAAPEQEWARLDEIRDDELWRAREQGRERLVSFVRERVQATRLAQGASVSDVAWTSGILDPKVLTVGFARRFATYKRATLLLSQPERLEALLLSPDKPVQFVFAGKAHPADDKGKALIQAIKRYSGQLHLRHRFVFIDDYDIAVARALYQGCDVWLNTPRRPQEACGTSGMKAALNGGLNCSILDGWWDEWFDGMNGWAISSAESVDDEAKRDEIEANSLFDLLEHQVVPMYYVRTEGPVPRRWVARVKHCLASLGPKVTATRMVRDYATELYEPAAAQADRVAEDGYAAARALARWKARVLAAWPDVRVHGVNADTEAVEVDASPSVEALVALGTLDPEDVAVQLVHGTVGPADELVEPCIDTMTFTRRNGDGLAYYRGSFACGRTGRYGFTVRVVPSHPDLATPVELGRISWA